MAKAREAVPQAKELSDFQETWQARLKDLQNNAKVTGRAQSIDLVSLRNYRIRIVALANRTLLFSITRIQRGKAQNIFFTPSVFGAIHQILCENDWKFESLARLAQQLTPEREEEAKVSL